MLGKTYKLKAKVWLYPGMAGWHFVSINKKASTEIKKLFGRGAKGFGSIPIVAKINATSWNTSVFPDKKTGTYLLPLKVQVRKKEKILANKMLNFSIKVRAF